MMTEILFCRQCNSYFHQGFLSAHVEAHHVQPASEEIARFSCTLCPYSTPIINRNSIIQHCLSLSHPLESVEIHWERHWLHEESRLKKILQIGYQIQIENLGNVQKHATEIRNPTDRNPEIDPRIPRADRNEPSYNDDNIQSIGRQRNFREHAENRQPNQDHDQFDELKAEIEDPDAAQLNSFNGEWNNSDERDEQGSNEKTIRGEFPSFLDSGSEPENILHPLSDTSPPKLRQQKRILQPLQRQRRAQHPSGIHVDVSKGRSAAQTKVIFPVGETKNKLSALEGQKLHPAKMPVLRLKRPQQTTPNTQNSPSNLLKAPSRIVLLNGKAIKISTQHENKPRSSKSNLEISSNSNRLKKAIRDKNSREAIEVSDDKLSRISLKTEPDDTIETPGKQESVDQSKGTTENTHDSGPIKKVDHYYGEQIVGRKEEQKRKVAELRRSNAATPTLPSLDDSTAESNATDTTLNESRMAAIAKRKKFQKPLPEGTVIEQIQCTACYKKIRITLLHERRYANLVIALSHVVSHFPDLHFFRCSICGTETNRRHMLQKHLIHTHGRKENFKSAIEKIGRDFERDQIKAGLEKMFPKFEWNRDVNLMKYIP